MSYPIVHPQPCMEWLKNRHPKIAELDKHLPGFQIFQAIAFKDLARHLVKQVLRYLDHLRDPQNEESYGRVCGLAWCSFSGPGSMAMYLMLFEKLTTNPVTLW